MPGLASLLRGRTTNPRGKTGGVVGYKMGGTADFIWPNPAPPKTHDWLRKQNQAEAAAKARAEARAKVKAAAIRRGGRGAVPRGWQEGGPVGVSPEEVEMASDIYARAAPEQQAQITGGGGGPGMMEEEAAIGEALAMAMGGGGGGPPMNGAPPMGGPPMGGMI